MPEDNSTQGTSQTALYPEAASREMIEAGVFYGRKKSKTNPKMREFVLASRGGIEIINLARTAETLESAIAFLKEKVRKGGLILFVGTAPAAEEAVAALAKKFNFPYATNRWAGGTITNFKVLSKRIEYFKKLRKDLAAGAFQGYTKKERSDLEKELQRLENIFGGLESLTKEPDVLVVVDPNFHSTAVREAKKMKIPVIALANLDTDPDFVDHLVIGNDKAQKSIGWFLEKLEAAINEGVALRAKENVPEAAAGAAAAPAAEK